MYLCNLMGCLKLTYHNFEPTLKVVYKNGSFEGNNVQRFLSLDPLAVDYAAWSAYNYVLGNPVSYVDPDGRSADNIIVETKRNDETNHKENTLVELNSLTDDELSYASDGKTVIIVKKGEGELSESTELIRGLIGDKSKTVKITNNAPSGYDLTKQGYTRAKSEKNARNGVGTSSDIYFSNDVKAKFTNQSGTREVSKNNTVLVHELIHADNNRKGIKFGPTVPVQNPKNSRYKNREEETTTIRENIIRDQLKQNKRWIK